MLWFGCLWTSEHTMKKNLTPTTQHREAAWSLAVTAAGLPAGLHFFHFRVNGAGGSDSVGQLVLSGVISCKWAVFLRLPIWTSSFMMASCGPGLRSVGRTHPRWKVECTVPQWFHPLGSHGEPEFRAVFFFSRPNTVSASTAECQFFLIGFMMFYVLPNLQKSSLLWSWMDFFRLTSIVLVDPQRFEAVTCWTETAMASSILSKEKVNVPMMAEIGAPGNQWTVSKTSKTQESWIPHYIVPIAVTGLMVGNRNGHVLVLR